MSEKLKKLQEYRDAILLAELGALIHDLGKLSGEFIKKQSLEGHVLYADYYHSKILEYDYNKNSKYYPNDCEIEHLAKALTDLLKRKIKLNGEEITIYEIIEKHHNKDVGDILLKFAISADRFDSGEDRGYAKDEQSFCRTFKSSAFGYEKELNIKNLLSERKEVYKQTINYLNLLLMETSCNFDAKNILNLKLKRKDYLKKLGESFSKTLGMTARSANDVLLWEHSYMVATFMKCLVAQKILRSDFEVNLEEDIKIKKPFSVFSIGWDFFEFIEQSHKVPDIVGRIKVLNEIKTEIKNIIEIDYAFGNEIYNDNFGIHFLIPSTLEDEDLKKVKEKIFQIFNEKLNGILLPTFILITPKEDDKEYKIGRLLLEAINKLKRKIDNKEYELVKVPKFIESFDCNDKLICEVCGKGFYSVNDNEKICETCKKLRKIGREQKQHPQTVYIDEISWNPKNKEYEKVCLLIAKFDLDDWLNGKYIESLFIRKPDEKDIALLLELNKIYNSKFCNDFKVDLSNVLRIFGFGTTSAIIYSRIKPERITDDILKKAKEKELNLNEIRKKISSKFNEYEQKILLLAIENNTYILKKLKESLSIENIKDASKIKNLKLLFEKFKSNINKYLLDYLNKKEKILETFKDKNNVKKYVSTASCREDILKLFQKPSSPSRIMRVWNTTKEFFNEIEKDICLRVPIIEEAIIKIKDIKENKKLKAGIPYIIKVEGLNIEGEVICDGNSRELLVVTPHFSEILKSKGDIKDKKIILKNLNDKKPIATASIEEIKNKKNTRKVRAFRTISKSPILFMALVPASKSFEIFKMIKNKYEKEFGKVYGKLPLHIGLIYAKRKTPLHIILEAAKRMLKKFNKKIDNNKEVLNFEVKEKNICKFEEFVKIKVKDNKTNLEYEIKVPFKLGDGNIDYYHPYLEIESLKDNKIVSIYVGDKLIIQKHILNITFEDKLKFNRYYFDFEYLDSNIRRFDLGANRKHWLFTKSKNSPKPYLLWDIDNFEKLRQLIKKYNLTNSQIMNFYELLISKIDEWELKNIEELRNCTEFKYFAETAILNVPLRLKDNIEDHEKEFLLNTIMNGLFFDFVDLWHTILKKDFKED